MPNIKKLRNNLKTNGFHITAFPFTYKHITYNVLFEVADNIPNTNKYFIAILTFIKPGTNNETLTVNANSATFEIESVVEFRNFFGIEYSNNLGDFFKQFYARFGSSVPEFPPTKISSDTKNQLIHLLATRNYHDPNAIYCFKVKRNPKVNGKQHHRSAYNSDLAFYARPELFAHFKNDNTISFCFSSEPCKEKSDFEIISNFAKLEIST